ncbi:MAG: YjjG family noncanonical pyrimidine nucleotidase [Flavobacteriaceae bacterium]|nr:YjjG family noncanonical pyrimidine nucleotidase [Flavobacteriaceae bacterium]
MNIKHIFFDLDHTLWDFETNSNKTFEFIFHKNNINIEIDDFKEIYKPINAKYWKLFREDKVSKIELRYARLREAFDALKFKADDNLIHTLSEEYIDYLADYNTLFEGALDVLNYLQNKYKMHIITNGFEEVQHRKLKNSNLLPFFDQIITSEKVGVKKPNPKIFQYALEASDAKSNESFMIGDNFEADIMGAKNIGMHTILCRFDGEPNSDNIISVTKLSQIKNYL